MAAGRSAPARFPPHGAWPAVMRADMASAYFDYENTDAFRRAVTRGEAPLPSDVRYRAGRREPVWALDACRSFVAKRHGLGEGSRGADVGDDLTDLV